MPARLAGFAIPATISASETIRVVLLPDTEGLREGFVRGEAMPLGEGGLSSDNPRASLRRDPGVDSWRSTPHRLQVVRAP